MRATTAAVDSVPREMPAAVLIEPAIHHWLDDLEKIIHISFGCNNDKKEKKIPTLTSTWHNDQSMPVSNRIRISNSPNSECHFSIGSNSVRCTVQCPAAIVPIQPSCLSGSNRAQWNSAKSMKTNTIKWIGFAMNVCTNWFWWINQSVSVFYCTKWLMRIGIWYRESSGKFAYQ